MKTSNGSIETLLGYIKFCSLHNINLRQKISFSLPFLHNGYATIYLTDY